MVAVSIIGAYANDQVTITPKGTRRGDGRYSYDGTERSVYVRVVAKRGLVRKEPGKDIGYRYEMWVSSDDDVTQQDHVTWNGETFEVVDIVEHKLVDGAPSHKKVRLG